MEKYSVFNDPTTGVNPFTAQPYRPTLAQRAVGVVLFALKTPLLVLAVALFSLSAALTAVTPFGVVQRAIRLTLERPAAGCALYFLGFWSSEVVTQPVRIRPSKSNPTPGVRSGDIVIANRTSFVDVLLLAARYAPVFTTTSVEGGLRVVSLWSALVAAASTMPRHWHGPLSARESVRSVLLSSLRGYAGPVVVFPEPCNTNNKAIMQFTPVAEQVAEVVVEIARGKDAAAAGIRVPTTHTLAIRYGSGPCSLHHVVGSAWAHAYHLATQPANVVALHRAMAGYDPQPADFFSASVSGGATGVPAVTSPTSVTATGTSLHATPGAIKPVPGISPTVPPTAAPATWPEAVRDVLAQLLRGSRAVALGYDQYLDFMRMWQEGEGGKGKA